MNARVAAHVSLAALLALVSLAGCHAAMPPARAVAALHDSDADTRRHAADDLRTADGVPPAAVPALLDAFETEQVPRVRGAILVTLGRSGAQRAKPLIDRACETARDPDERRWAERARKYWMLQNGRLAPDYRASYWVPFGGPTTPAKLTSE